MRIGLHVRTGGGYAAAIAQAKSAGATALQVFSSNPRTYRTSPIDVPALEAFARLRREADLDPCVVHTPYLINFASDDPKIYDGSLRLLRHDLQAAAAGSMRFVNTHLGSYGTRDRNEGFAAICRALEAALDGIDPAVYLVMENSAGAGNLAGGTLEELGRFVKTLDHPQLGVCLDTAHAWAAGYAIDSKDGVDRFIDEAEREIGLDRLLMFHFNDTEVPLGRKPRSSLAHRRRQDRFRGLSRASRAAGAAREDGDFGNAGRRCRRPAQHAGDPRDSKRRATERVDSARAVRARRAKVHRRRDEPACGGVRRRRLKRAEKGGTGRGTLGSSFVDSAADEVTCNNSILVTVTRQRLLRGAQVPTLAGQAGGRSAYSRSTRRRRPRPPRPRSA